MTGYLAGVLGSVAPFNDCALVPEQLLAVGDCSRFPKSKLERSVSPQYVFLSFRVVPAQQVATHRSSVDSSKIQPWY